MRVSVCPVVHTLSPRISLTHPTETCLNFGPADAAWLVAFAGNGTSKIVRYHSWNNVSVQGVLSRLLPGLAGGHCDETDTRVLSLP